MEEEEEEEEGAERRPLLSRPRTLSSLLQWKCWLRQPSFYQVGRFQLSEELLCDWTDTLFIRRVFSLADRCVCLSVGGLTLHVHQADSQSVSDLHLNVSHQHSGSAQGNKLTQPFF